MRGNLFELGFLVFDVLACNRIEFGNFDFFRSSALVLGCGVEMARSRRGFELYFFSHGNVLILRLPFRYLNDTGQVADGMHFKFLDAVAACAHFSQYCIDAILVNCTERFIGHAQADPATLTLYPEAATLQIGQKTPLCFIVRVGNVVAGHGLLPGNFTYSCHD